MWTEPLEKAQYYTKTHDVGFIVYCSFGNGFRLTGSEYYRDVIIQAARSLATRFNPNVGCFQSWNSYTFPVIIDNMMNLEIMFWASRNGGNPEWYDMAVSHSLRTMEDHIRPDGGTYQIVDYDPITGDILDKTTKQGYSRESTWARGQAWGIYGFTMAYRETGDIRFLEAAERLAEYFIDNLPVDYIPYWDFDVSAIPGEEKDASAAAIAVSAFIELSSFESDMLKREKYQNAATNILASLCSSVYLSRGTESSGIIMHAVQNHNENKGIDESVIYADYYFIEALLRYEQQRRSRFGLGAIADSNPVTFKLFQNYPNPFNASTTIQYWLPTPAIVGINIYDLAGNWLEQLDSRWQVAGHKSVIYDPHGLASGIYIIVAEAIGVRHSQSFTLIK